MFFYSSRGMFLLPKVFHFFLVLSCTPFCLTTFEPCFVNGITKVEESKEWEYHGDNHNVGVTNSGYDTGTSMAALSVESVCMNSHLFCFPSTLPGFLPEESNLELGGLEVSRSQSDSASSYVEPSKIRDQANNKSWLSNHGIFTLLDGRVASCSLYSRDGIHEFSPFDSDGGNGNEISPCGGHIMNQKSTGVRVMNSVEVTRSGSIDSSLHDIVISPPVMDWGQKYLLSPSVAYLTVSNTCNDSNLHVYEPFSTNIQFYPCNFSEILLGPGEEAVICFLFLPRWVGLSSAHIVLQTSSGGFLVQAMGFAVESPYEIHPLISLGVPFTGQNKDLSLFNPFDETLHVKEITGWISISLGNITHHTEAVCSREDLQDYNGHILLSAEHWLAMDGGKFGFPLMTMRPSGKWEISSQSRETIVEIDLSSESKAKILGTFCMKLWSSTPDKSDTVMIPLEVDFDKIASYEDHASTLSVSLEALVPYDGSDTVFIAISLENATPYVLSVVEIVEVADIKILHIKFMKGLLLFPGAATQVAVITCTKLLVETHDPAFEISDTIRSCKLLVMTNDSISPQIEVPCLDILHICRENHKNSFMGYEHKSEKVKYGNTRTKSLADGMQLESSTKVLETAEADELVLGNWKSQGTTSGLSVLEDHDVLFPMVQLGSHCSKWITVKNPSKHPVVMQLILHSGEIVDECRSQDIFMQAPSSSLACSLSAMPMRYGFSIGETAQTEAYVQPFGTASFGPVMFHPSKRCEWRSSALIRNNLSGVEWLSLRGFGGLVSLAIAEGSEPIWSVEFNLSLPTYLDISPPHMLFHMEETNYACSNPFVKELYAKNTGDLPLEVRSIQVSGTKCVLDGFIVHTCKGFSLEPGESTMLLISYQPDFSATLVNRDLELALASGILVIPMKATIPVHMLNLCKKSVFWMQLKKLSIAILLSASLLFLIFCFIFHQALVLGSHDYLCKTEKNPISAVKKGKSSHVNCNKKNSKFSKVDDFLSPAGDGKSLKEPSTARYANGQIEIKELKLTEDDTQLTPENERDIKRILAPERDNVLPCSISKSAAAKISDSMEATQPVNLTIRTGKEKGRRRRKRKGGFTGLIDVSSSQSGNSTPSSPLSPTTSVTPNRTWLLSPDAHQSIEARNPFTHLANQTSEKAHFPEPISKANVLGPKFSVEHCSKLWYSSTQEHSTAPRERESNLLPAATFHCADRATPTILRASHPLASTSVIAPHARAPGSKLYDQKNLKIEGNNRLGDEYTYDIWGDHFSGLHLMDSSKDVISLNSSPAENESDSFFVRGPQALIKNSQPRIVSALIITCLYGDASTYVHIHAC